MTNCSLARLNEAEEGNRRQETGGDRRQETGDRRRQETGGDRRQEETGGDTAARSRTVRRAHRAALTAAGPAGPAPLKVTRRQVSGRADNMT